jgi:N-acetylneuraminic acid mutarotase
LSKAVAAQVVISTFFILMLSVVTLRGVVAANPSTQWIKDIGSFSLGRGNSVIETADGSYALTGGKDGGFLLLKTNSSGDVQWEKTFGTQAEFTSFANSIVQTEDGGYILVGQGTPWPNFIGPNGTLFNLLKTDAAGNMQWNRSYSTEETPFIATSIIKTSDGGYVVAGYAETGHTIMGSGTGYVCLIKIDQFGTMQWRKQFIADPLWAPFHISVEETEDAGYALLTVTDFTENTVPVVENVDFWLIKTDSNGDIQWSETYGGSYNDLPSYFIETSDGGYLLAGSTLRNYTVDSVTYFHEDAWLVKTNSDGNMLWNKTYGGEGTDVITSVLESQNGGYVVAATIDASQENPPSGAIIFKTDTSGHTEWTVEYQGETQPVLFPVRIIEIQGDAYIFSGFRPRIDSAESLSIVLVKLTTSSRIPENSWTTKASMLTSRTGSGAAAVNGIIYVIGGSQRYNVTGTEFSYMSINATEAYDPATDTWIHKAPMPTPREGFGIVVYQNRIYCIGGRTVLKTDSNLTNVNEVYDPETDTWQAKTAMPTARYGIQANEVNGKVYLIGGLVESESASIKDMSVQVSEVYDPETDTWTTGSSIPTAVRGYSSAVVDGKIYIISGVASGSAKTNLTQIYDPKTDEWSLGLPIPMSVSSAAAVATTGIKAVKAIYVIGGSNETNPLNGQYANQVYFPETNSWAMAANMPIDRAGLAAAVVNDTIFVMGGGHNIFTMDSTTVMQYTPLSNPIGEMEPFSAIPVVITTFMIFAVAVVSILVYFKKHKRSNVQS